MERTKIEGFGNRQREIRTEGRRTRCLMCQSPLPGEPLLTLDGMPASAQRIPLAEELAQDQGISLSLCQCPHCGLVQFDCVPVDYYRDVIRSGGYSTTMYALRTAQYREFLECCPLQGKKILEVGCGQGEFLIPLRQFPVRAYGVEHKKDLAEIAVKQGLAVTEGFTETPDTRLGEDGPYDAFLSFNFLEHQPHPDVMLDCIYNNLAEEAYGLITVPSLEYILQYDGYYELIRDHIAYYTFPTLRRMLQSHGFAVLKEELVNRDTLSVIVKKVPKPATPDAGDAQAFSEEAFSGETLSGQTPAQGLIRREQLQAFLATIDGIRAQIRALREETEQAHTRLAIWGASHQGFTLAATTELRDFAAYIIDSAPFKQGRFAPASHLPILSPQAAAEDPAEVILIVAPGYTAEIARSIRERFGEAVRILTLRSDRIEELTGDF